MANLVYVQFSGLGYSSDGKRESPLFRGYSGAGSHKNNPKSQCISDLGPIPVGWYTMTLLNEHLGMANVVRLTPDPGNNMCGRSQFLIHGDSTTEPGTASKGCIIVNDPNLRAELARDFKRLQVIASDSLPFSPEVLEQSESFKGYMSAIGGASTALFGAADDTAAGVEADDDITRFKMPHNLGAGYRTFAGTFGARIIDHDAIVSAPIPGDARVESQFGLVLRREEIESALAADVSIAGSYGKLSGSAKASLRKNFSLSQTSVYLAFTKKVVAGVYRLVQYPVLPAASAEAANPEQFLLAYGDSLVTGVGLGGAICYIFKFNFTSETEATSFKASVGARYGVASGSASVSLREKIERIETSFEIYGYTTGTVSAPELFKDLDQKDLGLFNGTIGKTALANLFTYYDTFQTLFDDPADLIGYSQCEIEVQDFRTVPTVIENQREIGERGETASRIADELASQSSQIDIMIGQLSYVANVPDFSTDATRAEASGLIQVLSVLSDQIDARKNALVNSFDLNSPYDFSASIPAIPAHLCTADPIVEERVLPAPKGHEVFYDFPYNSALGGASCFVEANGTFSAVRHRPNGGNMTVKIVEVEGDFRIPHAMMDLAAGAVADQASATIHRGMTAHPKPKGFLFVPTGQRTFYAAGVLATGDYRSNATITLRLKTSRQSPPDVI